MVGWIVWQILSAMNQSEREFKWMSLKMKKMEKAERHSCSMKRHFMNQKYLTKTHPHTHWRNVKAYA